VITTRASGHSGSPVVGKACQLQAENLTFPLLQIPRATSYIDISVYLYNKFITMRLIKRT
jgi:hypothetical protein